MTSRSPGKAAETAERCWAAYGAAGDRVGLPVERGAQSAATNARNSSLLGRPRCSALCCSSLTPTSCHGAFVAAPPLCDSYLVSLITPTPRPPRSPRVGGRSLRARAGHAVRDSGPPTDSLTPWQGADGIDQRTARAVIDLAMRVGETLLSTGASASDVVATVLRLTDAYGLRSVHVDVTFTSISVSYHRGLDADPMTVMRGIKVRSTDLTRLERLQTLVRDIADERVHIDEGRTRFRAVLTAPHPYRRWVVTGSLATVAAAVAALFGGTWFIMALSFVTTAAADRVQHWLARRGIAAFFTQVVGGAVPTLVAVGLLAAISAGVPGLNGISPSLVVASGIVVLLAGLSVVGAAQDAIDGYYVTAGARGFEVLVLTLGIVVGIGGILALAQRAGVSQQFTATARLSTNTVVQVLAAMVVSGAFALSAYAGPRVALYSTLTGGLGWLAYLGAIRVGMGPAAASSFAALVAGFVSQLVASHLRVPALGLTMAGIVPLLPGLVVYQGLFEIVRSSPGVGLSTGLTTLLGAAGIGLGLGAGATRGRFLARPLRVCLDHGQRRALRRSAGDPRE